MADVATRGVDLSRTEGASSKSRDRVPLTKDPGVDRFIIAVALGTLVAAIPFVWLLWDMWTGTVHPARVAYNSDFYDAQARAIMHGHLWIKKSILDVEAFRHGSRYYTYFGVFPSLLRLPFLAIASNLYGKLTTTSMLVAWLLTALFSSMLIWRVRTLVRGPVLLGRAEAASYGVLVASICGGSVFLLLASTPWVYHEDICWSIALTVGTMFSLLGVMERPSRARVLVTAVFATCAGLDRLPTGWACVVGTTLVALWFATKRGGPENRRWAVPMFAVAVFALAVSCAVNWLKFGVPFGLPLATQVWTHINAHRRVFLARNGGKGYSFSFLPTTLWTYFQPFGIRFQSLFPFVTLPATPPEILGGAVFDQTYRTASVPASMPLLFLLACWGVVATFTKRVTSGAKLLRIPLVAAAVAFGVALLWGYIAQRFEGDIVPLLVVGSAAGMCHLWRVSEGKGAAIRKLLFSGIAVFGIFGLVANFGIAAVPTSQWSRTQTLNFVDAQRAISDITGHPIVSDVMHGSRLPYYEPAGRIFVAGNCSGLYLSIGEDYKNTPTQQLEHTTWLPVEQGTGIVSVFNITFRPPRDTSKAVPVPLVSSGRYTLEVEQLANRKVRYLLEGPRTRVFGNAVRVHFGRTVRLIVTMDPNLHLVDADESGAGFFVGVLPRGGEVVVHAQRARAGQKPLPVTAVPLHTKPQKMPLCRTLLRGA